MIKLACAAELRMEVLAECKRNQKRKVVLFLERKNNTTFYFSPKTEKNFYK